MTEKKIIRANDPKVLEFLAYLGVDANLSKKVVIIIDETIVIIEDTRMVEKPEDDN